MAKEGKKEYSRPPADSYRTGDVRPPKSYRSIITVLLLLVIFLGSLVSALSFANIKLFGLLQSNSQDNALQFMDGMRLTQENAAHSAVELPRLGSRGYLLTTFEQNYYGLPLGVYIVSVDCPSYVGIQTGDVLLRINGCPITDAQWINEQLESQDTGRSLVLDIYRDGSQLSLTVPLQ